MRKIPYSNLVLFTLLIAVAFIIADPAHAELSSDGTLDSTTQRFMDESAKWGAIIIRYATYLFWSLAVINLAFTMIELVFKQGEITSFFAEFTRYIIFTGLFWWLCSNGTAISKAIIDSMRRIGADASGISALITPSTPISIAFNILKKAIGSLSLVHALDNLTVIFVCIGIVLCMAIISANLLVALVNGWVITYAGTFILGLGGGRWTSDLVVGYFKTVLSIGLEIMTMALLIGIATSIVDNLYQNIDTQSLYDLVVVLCVCAVLVFLVNTIPARVASLAGAGGGSGASVGLGTFAAATAAAAAAGGIALSMGKAAAGELGGQAKALKAAFSAASSSDGDNDSSRGGGSEGAGSLADAMGGSNSGGGTLGKSGDATQDQGQADTSTSSKAPNTNEESLADGKSGKSMTSVMMGTAKNFAHGTVDAATDSIKKSYQDKKDRFAKRVDNSVGGKIAAAISARHSMPAATPKSEPATNKEVADFMDRKTGTKEQV